MKLSICTGMLERKFGLKTSIDILADAGFDALDLSLCQEFAPDKTYFFGDDYMKKAEEIRKYAEDKGVYFNQSHAYFPTSFDDEEKTGFAFDCVVKDMEIASAVGAKSIVVHPNCHLDFFKFGNRDKTKEMNYRFYSSLLPYAEKYDINIAIENLFQWKLAIGPILGRCAINACGQPEEHLEYIDMLKSDRIVACLDVGHAWLMGFPPAEVIKGLGHRLKALHIHDNDSRLDQHMIPFTPHVSSIDWDAVCKSLAEIGYDGEFTFESDGAYAKCDEEMARSLAKYNHDVGRNLIKKIEAYK